MSELVPFRRETDYFEERAAGIASMVEVGDPRALNEVARWHQGDPKALTEADARDVVARQHGFDHWAAFTAHLETLPDRADPATEPFRAAFEAIEAADADRLDQLLAAHPDLIHVAGTNRNDLLGLAGAVLITPDLTKSPSTPNDAAAGRLAIVGRLIAAGAKVNAANHKGWTPLHTAAYSNHLAHAQLLIGAGARADAEAYGDGGTPLVVALWWGHVQIAEYLAELALEPANLRVAAGLGRIDLLRAMIDPGGVPTPAAGARRAYHRPHSGFPAWRPTEGDHQEIVDDALSFAVRNGRLDAMAFLHDLGAGLDRVPCNGSPLQWAATLGRRAVARWLLDHGADVNLKAQFGGDFGHTALHRAAFSDDPEMIRLLVDYGADPSIHDERYDGTPLDWAIHIGKPAAELELKRLARGGTP